MKWLKADRRVDLGFLPAILRDDDPRPIKEQVEERYAHGGGWRPQNGFTFDFESGELKYPGDPPLRPVAMTQIHGDMVILFPYSYVLIRYRDETFDVMRMD